MIGGEDEMTAMAAERKRGIRAIVPEGYFLVSEAAELVGKSADTLTRWRQADPPVFAPENYMMAGKTKVWLYTEDDIDQLRKIADGIKSGPKPQED